MGLMKTASEAQVRERYQNIINQKEGWHEDIAGFLYDGFTELRQKLNLINRAMYKMFFYVPTSILIIGIVMLGFGISRVTDTKIIAMHFVHYFGTSSIVLTTVGSILIIAMLSLFLTGFIKLTVLKNRLSYLDRLIRNVGAKIPLEYNEMQLEKLVQMYIKGGRSTTFITNMGGNGGGYRRGYNPVMMKQTKEVVALSDTMQEMAWSRLFDMYNSVCRGSQFSMR